MSRRLQVEASHQVGCTGARPQAGRTGADDHVLGAPPSAVPRPELAAASRRLCSSRQPRLVRSGTAFRHPQVSLVGSSPGYQRSAPTALVLPQLGLADVAIGGLPGGTDKTSAQAISWHLQHLLPNTARASRRQAIEAPAARITRGLPGRDHRRASRNQGDRGRGRHTAPNEGAKPPKRPVHLPDRERVAPTLRWRRLTPRSSQSKAS